jgi:hypothetical protein
LTGIDRFSTSAAHGPADRIANDGQPEEAAMSIIHRITTSAVLVLSLAASAAPGAVVAPEAATAANPALAVYSRQDKDLVQPQRAASQPAAVYSRHDKSLLPHKSDARSRLANARRVNSSQPVVRIETPKSGFNWGDAGIGAAGGVALAMLGLGGALAISQRRPRRSHQTTSLS